MTSGAFNNRIERLEARRHTQLGPTEQEKEDARRIRECPALRRAVAYMDDAGNPRREHMAALTDEEVALLARYLEGTE
jgi:hypothetical protein